MVQDRLNVRLREAREKSGLSQQYVADELHVTRQSVSNWESRKVYPDLDNLVMLSDLYEVSLDWLLKGEKPEEVVGEESLTLKDGKEIAAILETQKDSKDRTFQEILSILLILVLSCNLPFVGSVASIVVAIWMIKTERKYKWMYVVCVVACIIGIYNTCIVCDHLWDWGTSSIEKISSL